MPQGGHGGGPTLAELIMEKINEQEEGKDKPAGELSLTDESCWILTLLLDSSTRTSRWFQPQDRRGLHQVSSQLVISPLY
jgi:hypothetical protein